MKHVKGITSEGVVWFLDYLSLLTAQNIRTGKDLWLNGSPFLLTAQDLEAKKDIYVNKNPSLLIAQNIQAGGNVRLNDCPSLLELAPTVEGEKFIFLLISNNETCKWKTKCGG